MNMHKERSRDLRMAARNLLIIALLISAMSAAFVIYQTTEKVITIVDEENSFEYRFRGDMTVGEILQENELYLEEMDEVSAPLSAVLENEATLEIKRSMEVTVAVDGKEYVFATAEKQVDKIIERLGLQVGALDLVTPEPATPLTADFSGTIQITRVTETVDVNKYPVKFAQVTRSNPSMDQGESKTIQRGSNGVRSVTEKVVYHDGVEFSRTVVEEIMEKPAVEEIKEVGTNVYVATSRGQTRFETAMYVNATAYCSCTICTNSGRGITASGTHATMGRTIATSSRFRFGTEFYIPYFRNWSNRGIFVVEDRGGSISGNRIDVYFDTHEEALRFGRKTFKVYVLN